MNSLKSKITTATLAIFVVGLWSLSLYISTVLQKDMEQLLGDQQFSIVSRLAEEVNHELSERLRDLQNVADGIDPATFSDPVRLQALLNARPIFQKRFNGGTFATDRQGLATASVPQALGRNGVNYLALDYIATALQEGRPVVGQLRYGQLPKTPVFGMAVPIRDAGGVVTGTLAGVVDLGQPNFLDRITASPYGKSGGYWLLAPKERLVVVATDKRRAMEALPAVGLNPALDRFLGGYEGSALMLNPDGVEVLSAVKGIPVAGWIAGAVLPTEEALLPLRKLQQRLLLASTLLTLLAGTLTWWMLRRQLSPLLATAQSVAAMADTTQPLHRLPVAHHDEVGKLIGGFNRLIETIGQRENALRDSMETLRTILETSLDGFWRTDLQGHLLDVNPAYCQQSGYTRAELLALQITDLDANDQASGIRAHILRIQATGHDLFETTHRRKDGSTWVVEASTVYSPRHGGQMYVFLRDITARNLAEEKLHLAASVFTHAREGILITAMDGTILEVNGTFSRITGYSRDEVLGQNPRMLSSGRQDKAFYAALWQALTEQGHWSGEIWNRRKNGEVYAELETISVVRDTQGQAQRYVALFSDITPLKEHQSQLEHIAHYDALTGLPNRVLLADRLHQSMAQAPRRGNQVAVVYLDLDGFKAINDNHGHDAGDQLLIAVSERLKLALREGDTLARMGGDEFVAVLVDLADVPASVLVLSRMLAAAAAPVRVGPHLLRVSASLGVTFYPQAEEVDADQLLRQADQAMYQAKLAGKHRYHVFDAELDRSVRGHHESLDHIRQALAEQQFVLHYQPKVDMRRGVVIGAEALIRWQHPTQGLLPPAVFLPAIENDPLAIDLGEWVIDTALAQMEAWQAAGLGIPVSVNIGARQLQQADFVQRLQALLARHPTVRADQLELEVLETSALEDLARVSQVMEACREIGVHFALDDFGTGYSSLTYLKRLPVALLKIDQSFVRDMLDDPDDLAILDGVIGLSRAFRREVIAEGVETVEHGEMLLQMGCDQAQGYGIARPMPAHALPAWRARWQPDPSWHQVPLVSRDDLPLLIACVEHRAWIKAMENYLQGERASPPSLDHQSCPFGIWLAHQGAERYGAQGNFVQVDALHRQMHGVAAELYALKTQGQTLAAQARSAELRTLADALLLRVKSLMLKDYP